MEFTPFRINLYTFFNLPSAWWCGVRVNEISNKYCSTKVNLNWINKTPILTSFKNIIKNYVYSYKRRFKNDDDFSW